MFFFLSVLALCEDCEIGEVPKAAETVSKMGDPSRSLLSKFGFTVNKTVPEFESISGIPTEYLYSVVGFGIPFIIVLILLVLNFIVHQLCCWCCCCRPQRAKKPGCCAIVVHLVAICVCLGSAFMFFFAASSFTKALANVEDVPKETKKEFGGVFDTVDGVLNDTFKLVHGVVSSTEKDLTSFVNWIIDNNKESQANCDKIQTDMTAYKKTFTGTGTPYKTSYDKIATALTGCKPASEQKEKAAAWAAMSASVDKGVDAINKVTQQLKSATDSIGQTAQNIKKTIDGSLKQVNAQISQYENGALRDTVNGFRTQINNLVDLTKPAETTIKQYGKYINLAVYVGTAFLVFVTLVFGFFFFCNNCCSRCLACCFPMCGLLLTVLIILPGSAFAAVFFAFYDVCPVLEDRAGVFLKDYMNASSFRDALLCPTPIPLQRKRLKRLTFLKTLRRSFRTLVRTLQLVKT